MDPKEAPAAEAAPADPQASVAAAVAAFAEGDLQLTEAPASDEVGQEASQEASQEDQAAEGEGEASTEKEGEEEAPGDATYVLALPGRRAEDPEEELELQGLTKQQEEAFNRLKNGYMRRAEYDQVMTSVTTDRAELDSIEAELRDDPEVFFLQRVTGPQTRESVALALMRELLADEQGEEAYLRIVSKLGEYENDPDQMAADRKAALQKLASRKSQRPAPSARSSAEDGSADDPVSVLVSNVRGCVPEDATDQQADDFTHDALLAVQRHLERTGKDDLDLDQVPSIIAHVLRGYGYPAPTRKAPPAAHAKDAPASSPPQATPQTAAGDTGKKLAAAAARRRSAVVVAPAGAGAKPNRLNEPPANQTVRERLQWYANQS
jgi:hypothetical protein